MKLAFLNIGGAELILIIVAILLIVAIGRYGKDTALGYWGSILLAIFTTPIIAFIVITFLKLRNRS
ncbi:MAG: hypothetical protein ABI113_05610 [Mucilaginibacter sp.]